MKIVPLKRIAKVDISNVDKKCKKGEKEVVLCNFVDVYRNWTITNELLPTMMQATANDNQIKRFSIHKGQVAITKDSETRDDIGVSTYIKDDIENAVLGYHCALITPDESFLKGEYLNVILHTKYAQKYFEANASGSGQRYTLTNDIIEDFPVPLPDDPRVQEEVGTLCTALDAKIRNNATLVNELEKSARLLYNYWFVQFDFPDLNGKPYRSAGGKMIWNDELKREIPEGWSVNPISSVADLYQPKTISEEELIHDGKYIVYGANGIIGRYGEYNHQSNEVAICCRGASCGHFLMTQPYAWITGNAMVVTPKNKSVTREYIYYGLSIPLISKFITGSAQPQITRGNLELMPIVVPDKKVLDIFDSTAVNIREAIHNLFIETEQLVSLREFLLPMLMNGQIKIV